MPDQTAPDLTLPPNVRDYSLTGDSTRRAIDIGLASAEWYHTEVPRKAMKDLMRRSDGPAIRDTVIWIGLLVLSGLGGALTWGTWWCVPFFFGYGVLYGSACDSRWHECGHGTAFRTDWMNNWVYQIASFMVMRNPVSWRWSHARHHTDTAIVGRDPEVAWMRPPNLTEGLAHYIGVLDVWASLKVLGRNAIGGLSAEEKTYIPESEWPKVARAAQVHMAIYAAAVVWALVGTTFLPLMLVGLPRIYGCWHMFMTGLLQHGGLAEDVTDHRLNTRTVYMNPVSQWIYWNMNYHVEHHMFPMVPYYNLPRLHALVKHDLPAPNPSIFHAYAEMFRAIWRQRHDPDHYYRRVLPDGARPYRDEFHDVHVARQGAGA